MVSRAETTAGKGFPPPRRNKGDDVAAGAGPAETGGLLHNMKKTWFYRLLLSYFPIFFVVTSVLILLTFLLLSEVSRKETINANAAYVRHVVQLIDHTLKEIDGMLIQDIETDERIRDFFQGGNAANPHYNIYEVSRKLNQMTTFNGLIDSVYLYRYADRKVLSTNMYVPLEQFGDEAFIRERERTPAFYELSPVRPYLEFPGQERMSPSVLSIVRKYPLLEGGQGLVVLNLSVAALGKTLSELNDSDVSFVNVTDAEGRPIFAVDRAPDVPGTVLSRMTSEFTGWTYAGGMHDVKLFRFASVLSYIWVGAGFFIVAAGTVWLAYVTKRNTKPIESIMSRIHRYAALRSGKPEGGGSDEFGFIEQAIDSLIEQSDAYRKLHEEDAPFRRRHFFLELMEASRPIGDAEWREELERFGMPSAYRSIGVAVYEIDKYGEATTRYSYRDFYLLKFVLSSVIKEVTEGAELEVWAEWTEQHRIAALYRSEKAPEEAERDIAAACEQVREWVEHNLDFTVCVGVGAASVSIEDASASYDGARNALSYKPSLGFNRVIASGEASGPTGERMRLLQTVRAFALAYRTGDGDWERSFEDLFRSLRAERFAREEHVQLLNAVVQHIDQEIADFPDELQNDWASVVVPELRRVRDTFDVAEEAQTRFHRQLSAFQDRIEAFRTSRSHYALMQEVKRYIEKEFANPDLSLTLLCDVFGLNGKYVSRLFKEAFGEKLVDFMVRVRIEESKKLLEETTLSLQQIANAVGYIHDISFIRAFKKVVGTTPGDYRKQRGQSLAP